MLNSSYSSFSQCLCMHYLSGELQILLSMSVGLASALRWVGCHKFCFNLPELSRVIATQTVKECQSPFFLLFFWEQSRLPVSCESVVSGVTCLIYTILNVLNKGQLMLLLSHAHSSVQTSPFCVRGTESDKLEENEKQHIPLIFSLPFQELPYFHNIQELELMHKYTNKLFYCAIIINVKIVIYIIY